MIISCFSMSKATEQVPDYLIYNGDTLKIFSNPLQDRESVLLLDTTFHNKICMSSDCWRGYRATWVLENQKLYLVKIEDCCNSSIIADLEVIFKEDHNQGKVFANWYSGDIIIPKGKLLYGEHMGYSNVYEFENIIEIMNGVQTKNRTVDNRRTDLKYMNRNTLSNYIMDKLGSNILEEIRNGDKRLDFYVDIKSDTSRQVVSVEFRDINEIHYQDRIRNILFEIDDWNVLYRRGVIADLPWIYPVRIGKMEVRRRDKHNKRRPKRNRQ